MTIEILVNKKTKGTKKAIVTTTVRTGAIIIATAILSILL